MLLTAALLNEMAASCCARTHLKVESAGTCAALFAMAMEVFHIRLERCRNCEALAATVTGCLAAARGAADCGRDWHLELPSLAESNIDQIDSV